MEFDDVEDLLPLSITSHACKYDLFDFFKENKPLKKTNNNRRELLTNFEATKNKYQTNA